MFINWKRRELNVKIVYYGPALAGKTTNLQHIHAHTHPDRRSELVSLKTREDRTLFFDFLQLELKEVRGLKPRFSLYTVPGQVRYAASRRLVLRGADGVVFVADSQRHCLRDNVVSMASLERYLAQFDCPADAFPVVLQCNKQDLPSAIEPGVLRSRLGADGAECFGAVATEGTGVFDTLRAIIQQVMLRLQ